jgi:hypothetical protein
MVEISSKSNHNVLRVMILQQIKKIPKKDLKLQPIFRTFRKVGLT